MATEKRLIDANALFEEIEKVYVDHYEKSAYKFIHDFFNAMRRRIRRAKTVDAVEVVHSRFVRIADFGDGEGCFGYCEKCGTVHHAQSPVALKADYRWCRWCGARMDGDGNET
jgi:hypothetical protein